MATETLTLEVDWGNTGLFDHAESDISEFIQEIPAYFMGRDDLSQLYGKPIAGTMTVILKNDTDIFSKSQSGSPIFGLIKTNRRVRLSSQRLKSERAAQFDGTNFLSVADNASLSTGDIDFTWAGWVYFDTLSVNRVIAGKGNNAGNLEWQLLYRSASDRIRFVISSNGTALTAENADNLGSPATGTWYFVVAWHDASANTLNIQVDNGDVDSQSYSSGGFDGVDPFKIGAGVSGMMDGRVEAAGFWKSVLSAADKTTLFNRGKALLNADIPASVATPISYWNLTEASGTRFDSVGSNDLADNNTVLDAPGNFATAASEQWEGFLDTIVADPRPGGANEATMECFGVLAKINARKVYIAPTANILTGTAYGQVLDARGIPAGDQTLDAGKTTMDRWFSPGDLGADALAKIVETENGFSRETRAGGIAFEDRHHRFKGAHQTVQATFSDIVGADIFYQKIPQRDAQSQIVNVIRAKVNRQTVASIDTLWESAENGSESPVLGPGETITFSAKYPTPNAPTEDIGVSVWTDPAATTDITANSQAGGGGDDMDADIGIANIDKGTDTMDFDVTNNDLTRNMALTKISARGTALEAEHETWVQYKGVASIAEFDEVEYLIPAEFLPNTNEANDYCRYIEALFGTESSLMSVQFIANETQAAMDAAHALDVSDRVEVIANSASVGLGIASKEMFIERKFDSIDQQGVHRVTLDMSDAEGQFGKVIILDLGPGLDTGILTY